MHTHSNNFIYEITICFNFNQILLGFIKHLPTQPKYIAVTNVYAAQTEMLDKTARHYEV